MPSSNQTSTIEGNNRVKNTLGNKKNEGVCNIEKSRCITHRRKLVKDQILKKKRVINKEGILEVKSIAVPILVCPDRNIMNIARPDTISALGGNTQMNRHTDRRTESLNLPSSQSIEGKVF